MKKPAKLLSRTITLSVALQRLIIALMIITLSVIGTGVKTAVAAESVDKANETSSIFSQLGLLVTDSYSQYTDAMIPTNHLSVTSCDDSALKTQITETMKTHKSVGFVESALSFISHCDETSLIADYGPPNKTIILTANDDPAKSQRLLVFEPSTNPDTQFSNSQVASLLPLTCKHHTIIATVAHEDDDLLFMNPAIAKHIANGGCMVTIYLTAGDFGHDAIHWQNRRFGSEAAYAAMAHQDNSWVTNTFSIDGKVIQSSQITNKRNVLHIYLQLPDGGVGGAGFASNNFESLKKFINSPRMTIHTIDKTSSYTKQSLLKVMTTMFVSLSPSEIWTQDFMDSSHVDHADHVATGELTRRAFYDLNHSGAYFVPSLKLYAGYELKTLPQNVSAHDSVNKKSIFHDYAVHDITICDTSGHIPCDSYGVYELYFSKQYSRTFKAQ